MGEKKLSNLLCLSLYPYFKYFHDVINDAGNSIFLYFVFEGKNFLKVHCKKTHALAKGVTVVRVMMDLFHS